MPSLQGSDRVYVTRTRVPMASTSPPITAGSLTCESGLYASVTRYFLPEDSTTIPIHRGPSCLSTTTPSSTRGARGVTVLFCCPGEAAVSAKVSSIAQHGFFIVLFCPQHAESLHTPSCGTSV